MNVKLSAKSGGIDIFADMPPKEIKVVVFQPDKNFIATIAPGAGFPNLISAIAIAGQDKNPDQVIVNFIEPGRPSAPAMVIVLTRDVALKFAHGLLEYVS